VTVASFDVFDTVLTRTVGSPDQVFLAIGRLLRRDGVLAVPPETYSAARREAVHDLTADPATHPTLAAVSAEVAGRLGLPTEGAARLADAELSIEAEVCRAVPGAPERVAGARRRTGRGVVFVSDTSMPADSLESLLRREKLFLDGDELFTSAALGASKQDGGLYDLVAARLGLPGQAFEHVGDDRWSDLAHARLHGWGASLDTRAVLDRYELDLAAAGPDTDGLGPRLAGAGRLGRLAAADEGIDGAIAGIASGVAMPLLVGFGLWVLQQAQLLGLQRLYFVARDGEVFLDITRRLAESTGAEVECHYLYGSRRSWQLAATGAPGVPAAPWIPDDRDPAAMTAREVLELVDLTPELARTADPTIAGGGPLGTAGWDRLAAALREGPLASLVTGRAAGRRALLLRYLDQEGVTAEGRVGLVDVGWTGRAARSLEDVLRSAARPLPAAHLFLGLSATAPERMGADLFARSQGWLLDEARGRRDRSGDEDPVMIVESFAMGSEGHTVGYVETADGVRPVLAATTNPAAGAWRFAAYRRGLSLALDALLDGPPPPTDVDLRPVAWRQLLRFWTTPTADEAVVWGAQPYGEDFANATGHPLATAVTGRRMLTRLGIGRPGWREPTYWLAGTVALSPQPWRSVLQGLLDGRRTTARLTRLPRRARGEWALRRG
jgi:FMN phosphatase YigB (HAD superfamily)